MSKATRINRPTTSTKQKPSEGRMVWQSTNYAQLPNDPLNPTGPSTFRPVSKGNTYRKGN